MIGLSDSFLSDYLTDLKLDLEMKKVQNVKWCMEQSLSHIWVRSRNFIGCYQVCQIPELTVQHLALCQK